MVFTVLKKIRNAAGFGVVKRTPGTRPYKQLHCTHTPHNANRHEPSEVASKETAIFEQAFLKHNWTTSVGNVRKPKTEQDREMYFFIA